VQSGGPFGSIARAGLLDVPIAISMREGALDEPTY